MKVKFGDIVREVKLNVDRTNNPYEFYVAGDHMDGEDLTIRRKGRFDTDDVGPAFTRIFRPGQILYGSRRTYLKKVAVADFDGICSNTTFILESKEPNVFCQELLPFIMLSEAFTKWSVSHSKGSTNPYVLFSDLAGFTLNLPSLDEQKVLADKLWAAYRVKESYRKLLAATDDMVKAKFIKMVLDKDWPTEQLPNLASYCIGLTYKPVDVCDDGVVVLRSGNIQNAQIDLLDIVRVSTKIRENLFVRENDILMCSRNGSAQLVGKTALIPKLDEPMTYGAFMTVIRSEYNRYLALYFQTDAFRKQLSGAKSSVMNQVTQKMLDEIIVPIPDNQTIVELTSIATQAEATKASLRQSIESIDRVIKSLINQ